MFVVYLTTYKGNKLPPFYIGYSTKKKVLSGYRGSVSSQEYRDIWKEEIKENPHLFITKIISTHDTKEEALLRECQIQKFFNVHKNPMYINRAIGNKEFFKRNTTHSDETKLKMSLAAIGHKRNTGIKKSSDHKEKISKTRIAKGLSSGKNNPMYGKTRIHSDETKFKISESNKGRIISEYQKKRIIETNKSRNVSKETRIKMAESNCNSIKITDGINTFRSQNEAARYHNISVATVTNRCKNTSVKFTNWKFLGE